ncbi:hypothetical protein PBY51_013548 [Eleginops maclovinus]|uniref:Uncharacterized protein n=1 Tax=Eleginops maclovinus TaxID=56733 RepID=A0AAN7Y8B9_ELEMC|nr:hypothetical protein PBY51_013548 [Eleginops maclovinus]
MILPQASAKHHPIPHPTLQPDPFHPSVFPFCTPTTTFPPPHPFSLRWTFSRHPTLLSAPRLPAPATAGLNLQLIDTFALFGCGSML